MNLLHLIQDRIRGSLRRRPLAPPGKLLPTPNLPPRGALDSLVADVEPYAAMVKPTQDAKHGDYQANCAMSLAKTLGKKPRDVAQEIVDRLELGDLLHRPEIAGPGFINLRLQDSWMAKQLQALAADERLGVAAASPPKTF